MVRDFHITLVTMVNNPFYNHAQFDEFHLLEKLYKSLKTHNEMQNYFPERHL